MGTSNNLLATLVDELQTKEIVIELGEVLEMLEFLPQQLQTVLLRIHSQAFLLSGSLYLAYPQNSE